VSIAAGIKALLTALPWPVYDSDASGATRYPYILLLAPAGGLDPEHSLGGPRMGVADEVLVRAVALDAEGVRGVLARSRTVLTREGRPLTFDVDGWRVTLSRQAGGLPLTVDRDATVTGMNRHPQFATDFYDLRAIPL
jgi:hypothetical protein